MAGLVDEGKAVDIVYLDLSNAFDNISNNIHIEKLMKYELDKQVVKTGWSAELSVVISVLKSKWRPVPQVCARDQYWHKCCLTPPLMIQMMG